MMEIPVHRLEERARYITEAKEASFLDAVFLIHDSRHSKEWRRASSFSTTRIFSVVSALQATTPTLEKN